MKSATDILAEVSKTLSTTWTTRDGQVVPDVSDLKLGNDGVILDATVLYADMTDSTGLVDGYKDWFAAEVYKSYLLAACHVIRNNAGSITSFDGDRVMGIFIAKNKNTIAAKTALQISFITAQINEKLKKTYPTSTYQLKQTIGIDTSKILVARTGIRDANDLVWVGPAANHAAKLCAEANDEYPIIITDAVYKKLHESSKMGVSPQVNMWEKHYVRSPQELVYRTNWYWQF